MNYEEEINQLREQIQNRIGKEGFSTLLNTLATLAMLHYKETKVMI